MHESFEKWMPDPAVNGMYDIVDIAWTVEGLTVTVIPDGGSAAATTGPIRLIWPSCCAYCVTDERYREDCWIADPAHAWSFFLSDDSPALARYRTGSALWPAEIRHYLVVGTNYTLDIFAAEPPLVTANGL